MKIYIREVDDWTAVYKDGKIVWDNHSCPLKEGLEALGIPFEYDFFEDDEFDNVTIQFPDGTDVFPRRLDIESSVAAIDPVHAVVDLDAPENASIRSQVGEPTRPATPEDKALERTAETQEEQIQRVGNALADFFEARAKNPDDCPMCGAKGGGWECAFLFLPCVMKTGGPDE